MRKNHKILIANRGEIAVRVIRACRSLGLPSVVVYSEADRNSLAVQLADEAICIGKASAGESYLRIDRIIAAAEISGATAIHPGYGFLSENAHFAEICKDCGIIFIGPSPEAIKTLGNKKEARDAMQAAGVPVTPGSECLIEDVESAKSWAEKLGYPVILKAVSGGGGRGMRIAYSAAELENAFDTASKEALHCFNDASLYMEKFQVNPRHVEIQILADRFGNVVQFGDRDCSLQRRHQKVLEESPCSSISAAMRKKMQSAAVKAASSVNYTGAGTVEFLVSDDEFYFMEMNTRLQVEHPVTESTTGVDLVREQIRIALGEKIRWAQKDVHPFGHAIEMRINAEDPDNNFVPCPGKVSFYLPPGGPGVRVDSHLYSGYEIPPFYDNLLAKIIVHAPNREICILRAKNAIRELTIQNVKTNIPFFEKLLNSPEFQSGQYNTGTIDEFVTKNHE